MPDMTDQEIAEQIAENITSNGLRDLTGAELREVLLALNDNKANNSEIARLEQLIEEISGMPGTNGTNGWSPVLAVVVDGARRVYQVVAWIGGSGTPPPVNKFLGPTDWVNTAAEAVDVRGPAGSGGAGAVDSVNGQTGEVILDKADVGLQDVDNTSDADKPISTAQQNALDQKANKITGLNVQTDDYVLVISDAYKIVEMNKATAVSLTIPPNVDVAFPIGTETKTHQLEAGQATIVAGDGVTIRTAETLLLAKRYAGATLYKRATNEWILIGNLELV